MNENIKAIPTVPLENMEHNQSDTFDPRDDSSVEYFDDYMYDGLYYDDICMSCQHWTDGICDHEHETCSYEPF